MQPMRKTYLCMGKCQMKYISLKATIAVPIDLFFFFRHIIDPQGSHRLEKYLNIQDCLEKSLKIRFALKSTGKTCKGLEKSLNFTIYRRIQHCLWRSKSV